MANSISNRIQIESNSHVTNQMAKAGGEVVRVGRNPRELDRELEEQRQRGERRDERRGAAGKKVRDTRTIDHWKNEEEEGETEANK